ncbi:glycerophosphodiester phosphodiesterase [soil metagenome]
MPLRRSPGRPLVIAHRGLRGPESVENTPAAFAAAAAAGADWVELDIRRSADGVAVVHHDPSFGAVDIVACTAQQLAAAGIHSLREVLATMPVAVGVILEVKNLPGEPDFDESEAVVGLVAEAVHELPAGRQLLTSAFSPLTVAALRDALPQIATGLVHFDSLGLPAASEIAVEYGAQVVASHCCSPGLDAPTIAALRDAGLGLAVWTVNDPDRAAALAELGVDGLLTDEPAALRARLG